MLSDKQNFIIDGVNDKKELYSEFLQQYYLKFIYYNNIIHSVMIVVNVAPKAIISNQ